MRFKFPKHESKLNKSKSSFTKGTMTAIACLLMFSVVAMLMMFKTDTLIDINTEQIEANQQEIRSVTSYEVLQDSTQTSSAGANIPGVTPVSGNVTTTTGKSKNSHIDTYAYDEDVYKLMLKHLGAINSGDDTKERKCKDMAALWLMCSKEFGQNFAIAAMANCAQEGCSGMVQEKKSVDNWEGDGQSKYCDYGSLMFVQNEANVKAVKATAAAGNHSDVGFGIIQWTYYSSLATLGTYYEKYLNNGQLSIDDCRAAEIDCLYSKYYKGKSDSIKKKKTPEEATVEYTCTIEWCSHKAAAIADGNSRWQKWGSKILDIMKKAGFYK